MTDQEFIEQLRRDSLHMSEYHILKERCNYCKAKMGNNETCPKEDEAVCHFTPTGVGIYS